MNSFNHCALGSVGQWLYETVGGLKPDCKQPGFKHFVWAPEPGGGLDFARVTFNSTRGRIESSWQIEGTELRLQIMIPPGCTSTARLPGEESERFLDAGTHSFRTPRPDL